MPSYRVVAEEKHYRANGGDHDAVQIEPVYAGMAEYTEQPATYDGAHYAQQRIENNAFSTVTHNVARDETGHQTE
jgi:hypothetical protein